MSPSSTPSKPVQFAVLLVAFFLLCLFVGPSDSNYFWRLPALFKELPFIINDTVRGLMFEWMPIEVYDPTIDDYESKPLFREITRTISSSILSIIVFVREVVLGGVKTIVAFTSWDFVSNNSWARWPALPWTVISGWAILLGYKLQGKGLASLAALSTVYIAVFGQWEPSMQTLSFVLIAAPASVILLSAPATIP